MKHKQLLLLATTALTFNAAAATTDWGVHDTLEFAATLTPVGSYSDTYLFSLAGDSGLFSTSVSNNLTNVLGLDGATVTLFKDAAGPDLSVGSYGFDGTSGSTSHSFGSLAAGAYYYVVAGVGIGSSGGFYALSSTPAVPEPGVLSLMLAGLGLVGFSARRKLGAQD